MTLPLVAILFLVGVSDRPVLLDQGVDCTTLYAAYSSTYSRPHLVCVSAAPAKRMPAP